MSLFRSEARKDRNARLSTADMAAMGDEAMERPVSDGRADADPQTEREARRASLDERASHADGVRDVEDAVIKHEHEGDDVARRTAETHGPRAGDGLPRSTADGAETMDTAQARRSEAMMSTPPTGARIGDGHAPRSDGATTSDGQRLAPLFSPPVAQDFRGRWDQTQIGFVDNPRHAVQQADELVAQVMQSLAQSFAQERRQLESQMNETASTENLRVALQRYRSFFQRLLSL
jgi:hypothetical protein